MTTRRKSNGRSRTSSKVRNDQYAPVKKDQKIRLLAKENPRKAGTEGHKNWKKYQNGMTVKQFQEKAGKGALTHLRWDVAHEFVAVR